MNRFYEILMFCISFLIGGLFIYGVLTKPDFPTFMVDDGYEDSFAATCGIAIAEDEKFTAGGTGVALRNGNILSAKHVADKNSNGIIDWEERTVLIKYYYPEEIECKGFVIYAPPEKLRVAKSFDFMIIRPDIKINSNIRLVNVDEHLDVGAGRQIYTIGRMEGNNPHITFGNQSTTIEKDYLYDRIAMRIWFGNSGGGIFTKDNHELLGVASIVKDSEVKYNPAIWAGYMSATNIRLYLWFDEKEYLIDSIEDTRAYKLQSFILCSLILLNCFLGVYFGCPVLCEKVRDMQRDDATL